MCLLKISFLLIVKSWLQTVLLGTVFESNQLFFRFIVVRAYRDRGSVDGIEELIEESKVASNPV